VFYNNRARRRVVAEPAMFSSVLFFTCVSEGGSGPLLCDVSFAARYEGGDSCTGE
jgi:hypothetical protein